MTARQRSPRCLLANAARVLAVMVAIVGAVGGTTIATPRDAAAQARLVNALVRTFPARPAPGDDVIAVVGVTGCPPGPVTVELYLTTSDGATQSSTLMTRAAATTNLVFRTRAVLRLPDAVEGWYGARVLCGTYRPPKVPMANTLFAVGAKPTKQSTVGAGTAAPGSTLPYSGDGCPGTTVEYALSDGGRWPGAFIADGSIPVGPDGRWSTDLAIAPDRPLGLVRIRARCVLTNRYDETIYVYYDDSTVEIERSAAP